MPGVALIAEDPNMSARRTPLEEQILISTTMHQSVVDIGVREQLRICRVDIAAKSLRGELIKNALLLISRRAEIVRLDILQTAKTARWADQYESKTTHIVLDRTIFACCTKRREPRGKVSSWIVLVGHSLAYHS